MPAAAFSGTLGSLSGCGQRAPDVPNSVQVACKDAQAADFKPVCALEKAAGPEGTILTLTHPDGHFRRLLVTRDGRGVIAADGAGPASVTISGDSEIEVALDGDSYRLPATLKGKAFPKP